MFGFSLRRFFIVSYNNKLKDIISKPGHFKFKYNKTTYAQISSLNKPV